MSGACAVGARLRQHNASLDVAVVFGELCAQEVTGRPELRSNASRKTPGTLAHGQLYRFRAEARAVLLFRRTLAMSRLPALLRAAHITRSGTDRLVSLACS
jgi:hypothetical protein